MVKRYAEVDSVCCMNLAVTWTTCYFCIPKTSGFSGKSKHKIEYLNTDSSKVSLKAVLLHDGNKDPPIPLDHAVNQKQTYANIQGLLKKIIYMYICVCYKDCQWNIRKS